MTEQKLSLTNINSNLYDNNFNLGLILISMIVWSVLFIPLMWYLGKIMPSQFGIAKPLYFPFIPSYWTNKFKYKKIDNVYKNNSFDSQNNEFESSEEKPTVILNNITKVFLKREKKNL